MAYREIIKVDDPILRKKAKKVCVFDENMGLILDDMAESLFKFNGAGLAGPQVGILKRIAVVYINSMFFELINPEIIDKKGEWECEEGCLSIPKIRGVVKRPYTVTVKAFDRKGYEYTLTAEDMLARCICHELDHLDGILFIDKMEKEVKSKSKAKKR
ncbi:MAG: peptide deformylase [Clostridia bacterium]|nr:peptide deformylase [Clostridia bacterium]